MFNILTTTSIVDQMITERRDEARRERMLHKAFRALTATRKAAAPTAPRNTALTPA
ncbi:MAG TPA: hypothetical protein VFR15_13905 [Chloroflexia bacterium]|nr:hypothetical protein [Chloroflexia bacterium]